MLTGFLWRHPGPDRLLLYPFTDMNKKAAAGFTVLLLVTIAFVIAFSRHHAYHKRNEKQLKAILDSLRKRDTFSTKPAFY